MGENPRGHSGSASSNRSAYPFVYCRAMLSRDAASAIARAQVHARRATHVFLRRVAQPARRGARDRAERRPCVVEIERVQNGADRLPQLRRAGRLRRPFDRGGHRRAQQHDAQVGVAACRGPARLDRRLDARADPDARRRRAGRRRPRRWSRSCAAVMPWPGESTLTLPGLRTATSSRHAHRNAARARASASCTAPALTRGAPARPRRVGVRPGRPRARRRC